MMTLSCHLKHFCKRLRGIAILLIARLCHRYKVIYDQIFISSMVIFYIIFEIFYYLFILYHFCLIIMLQ